MELIETPNSNYSKVSLERYRISSNKIFEILQSQCTLVQKASIDEAYCDITLEVDNILKKKQSENKFLSIQELIEDKNAWNGKVLPLLSEDENLEIIEAKTIGDIKLLIGSSIIQNIRNQIFEELGFTCSAGISHNKTFAKLTTSYNKPNGQTIVREGAIKKLLQEIKLKEIPGLGRKLGNKLCEMDIITPIQLQNESLHKLTEIFGEKKASWLYDICRGIDLKPVESGITVKSIMAAKCFSCVYNYNDLDNIIDVLCVDLVQRINIDYDIHYRIPQTLTIQFYSISANTLSIPMPTQWNLSNILKSVIRRTLEFKLDGRILFPCSRLALQASNFLNVKGTTPISKYFSKKVEIPIVPPKKSSCIKIPLEISNDPPISNSLTDLEESIEYFKCNECSKLIEEMKRNEHYDFHYAQQISKELNKNSDAPVIATPKVQKQIQKPKTKPKKPKSDQRAITAFFKL